MADAESEEPIETVDEGTLQNADTEVNTEETKEAEATSGDENVTPPKKPKKFHRFFSWYKSKKKLSIPLTVVLLLLLLLGIPITRYAILGLAIKNDVSLKVIDSQNNLPVSGVELSLGGETGKTDAQGNASIKGIKVGRNRLRAAKKYYKDSTITIAVPLRKVKDPFQLKLEATGRQVPISVINKITGKGVSGATVQAADTEAQTDKNGTATLVLPPNQTSVSATISAKDYNDTKAQITINSDKPSDSVFSLTPSGKIYFLSKKSGKIDVVKTDLDGNNRQTVLAGTGQEEEGNTILLASRDWKYLALQSRRDSDQTKLYLIDTNGDKLSEIDSGDATFTPVGWNGHYFAYKVSRNKVLVWQPKAAALKTFNAENQQSITVDETDAEGSGNSEYATETLDNVYILNDALVYSKSWSAPYYSSYRLSTKRAAIYSAKPNGTGKQNLKDFPVGTYAYITGLPYKPDEIYFSISTDSNTSYYEYAKGVVKESKDIVSDIFSQFYATYLASPNGQNTFWYEPRDGKNTLFTGTANGDDPKEIASLSEYVPYGWYGDNYLLVSKNSSELYILPTAGPSDKAPVLKVTDYHKPNYNFRGYGYGYGGF